jgi:hypothetical protein
VAAALQSGAAVHIETQPAVPAVSRAADVLRLAVALFVLVAVLLLAGLAHGRVRAAEVGLLGSVTALPEGRRDPLTRAVQLVAIGMPVGLVVAMAVRRKLAVLGRLLVTCGMAIAVATLISHLVLGRSHPVTWPGLLAGRGAMFVVTCPPLRWLCGIAALLTVAGPELSRRGRVGLWWLAGGAAVAQVVAGGVLPLDAVAAVALGVSVGAVILLAFGPRRGDPPGPRWWRRCRNVESS